MTAVEWLKSKIIEDIRMDNLISGSYSKEQYKLFLLDKIQYALELEKEQIMQAYKFNATGEPDGAEHYYEMFYKK